MSHLSLHGGAERFTGAYYVILTILAAARSEVGCKTAAPCIRLSYLQKGCVAPDRCRSGEGQGEVLVHGRKW